MTKIVLTTAGDIFAKTVGGGGETAWLLMEDEVVKEEDKKQANEPLLRKYVASYGKFFLPAGGLAVRPWAPRGYKVAKSKPDVIDLEADAPRHAHPVRRTRTPLIIAVCSPYLTSVPAPSCPACAVGRFVDTQTSFHVLLRLCASTPHWERAAIQGTGIRYNSRRPPSDF